MKKISIITVTLNSELTVRKTLDSVYCQSFKDIEHIIVDGGSIDKTKIIIKEHPNKLIKYHELIGSSIYEAMNYGIKLASNEFLVFLNSDDYYKDCNSIASAMNFFFQDTSLDAVFNNVEFFNGDNESKVVREYKCNDFKPKKLYDGIMPPHPGIIIKTEYYRILKGFSENYKIAADFNFLLRLFIKFNINYINSGNVLVRMKTGGISTGGIRSKLLISVEIYRSLRENLIKVDYRFIYVRIINKLMQIKL